MEDGRISDCGGPPGRAVSMCALHISLEDAGWRRTHTAIAPCCPQSRIVSIDVCAPRIRCIAHLRGSASESARMMCARCTQAIASDAVLPRARRRSRNRQRIGHLQANVREDRRLACVTLARLRSTRAVRCLARASGGGGVRTGDRGAGVGHGVHGWDWDGTYIQRSQDTGGQMFSRRGESGIHVCREKNGTGRCACWGTEARGRTMAASARK